MEREFSFDEVAFFETKPGSWPLYACLREKLLNICEGMDIQVKKTQISFFNRHLFAAVSFLPVRRKVERPDPYLTVSFGLGHRQSHRRIAGAVEAYPNRWTHHVLIGSAEEVDGELLGWLAGAADFAEHKR